MKVKNTNQIIEDLQALAAQNIESIKQKDDIIEEKEKMIEKKS